jgi:N-methylhydantoinase B
MADNTMMAGPTCGTGGSVVLSEFLPSETSATVTIIQSLRGGMSAYKGMDGVDVRDVTMNTMHNHPIETIENKCGVRIMEYDVRTDSCGAGQWRGGAGQVMTVEVLRDGGTIQLRGMDRFRFAPWGVAGGKPGETIRCIFNRGIAGEREVGKTEEFPVKTGDTVTVMMPGAAGFGDAFQRDPEAVLWDVEQGFVSREAAEREYGVVIDEAGALDAAATEKTRRVRVRENIGSDFDFGREREAWESVFDDATMCELNRLLYTFPKSVRQAKRRAVFHAALPEIPKAGSGSLTGVLADTDAVRARLKAAIGDILGAGATQPVGQAAQ